MNSKQRTLTYLVLSSAVSACGDAPPATQESMEPGGRGGAGSGGGDSAVGGMAGSGPSESGADHGLALLGDGSNQCSSCPQLGDLNEHGEVLVFSDDFIKSDLDRSVWTQEVGMIRNQEEQCYLDRAENILVVDGALTLRAIHESLDDPLCYREWEMDVGEVQANYTSAAVTTVDFAAFKYGRIEARIRVPGATGTWPAFWMRPLERVYGNWPLSGEIDVMENVSQEPHVVHGTVHFDFFGHMSDGNQLEHSEPLGDDFHIYAIDWKEERIDWFFDGQHYHSFDLTDDIQGRRPFNESFYLLLNVAVGGHWPEAPDPSQYPAEMSVDWVRVWQAP